MSAPMREAPRGAFSERVMRREGRPARGRPAAGAARAGRDKTCMRSRRREEWRLFVHGPALPLAYANDFFELMLVP